MPKTWLIHFYYSKIMVNFNKGHRISYALLTFSNLSSFVSIAIDNSNTVLKGQFTKKNLYLLPSYSKPV